MAYKPKIQITAEQILELKSQGLTQAQIADRLGCEPYTISRRLASYRKTKEQRICPICHSQYSALSKRNTCGRKACREEYKILQGIETDQANRNPYTDATYLLMAIYLSKGEPLTQMARDTGRPLKELQEHLETDKAKIDRQLRIMDIQHRQSKPGGVQTVVNWSAMDRWDL